MARRLETQLWMAHNNIKTENYKIIKNTKTKTKPNYPLEP